jgi:nicotinate-nucleotide pyrophosphorylase (carboxylating)
MTNDVHPPLSVVRAVVARALAEDLEPLGDITAALLPAEARGHARFVAREAGVLAGRACADEAFAQVDEQVTLAWRRDDGDALSAGDVLADVEGPLRSILTAERTALNLLGHLSGVASLTRAYVLAATEAGHTRVLDTRKTTPGLRALEKAAVRAGGGVNHRGSLSEGVLLKDNHLGAVRIPEAVERARAQWPGRMVEVECDRIEQVREAVAAGATMVLLDNMSPVDVARCVEEVDGRCVVEVSGNVTLDNVAEYAKAGADFVSVGRLTHSAPTLDIGLDLS